MKDMKAVPQRKLPRRVTVEEAENGYSICGYDEERNEIKMIARDMNEAADIMAELLKESSDKDKSANKNGGDRE